MISVSPEQLQVLQRIIDNTAPQASVALSISIDTIESFLSNLTRFVQQNYKQIGNRPYAIFLGESKPKTSILDSQTALRNIRKDKPILYVDTGLRFIRAEQDEALISTCSKRSEDEKNLGILIEGTYAFEILCGKVINEGDILKLKARRSRLFKWHRPMSEFDLILQDHMESVVAREQGLRYWQDRSKRILLAGPDGTEKIFHHGLFWWLKNFVSDKLRVYAEPSGLGQNKTDIIVVTMSGSHVIEVKWLGRNEKGTRYDQPRINEGLVQVSIYLNQDDELVSGYLVIYDGREHNIHTTKCGYDDTLRHSFCEPPKILFLDSEPPSKAATRSARGRT